MIHSMTGFGRAVRSLNGREITVELRSVNNRFLDCTVKLPRAFSYAEDAVKQLVKANVARGKVDVFISVNVTADENVRVSLNRPVLEGYLTALREIAADYGVRDDVSATALARFPEVFTLEKAEEDEERNTADIAAAKSHIPYFSSVVFRILFISFFAILSTCIDFLAYKPLLSNILTSCLGSLLYASAPI